MEPHYTHHPVDDIEPMPGADGEIDLADLGHVDPQVLPALLRLILPAKNPTCAATWTTASARLAVVCHAVLPEVRQHSLTAIADAIGCSRALLSFYACRLRDEAGLSCQAGKSDRAREVYAERARGVWRSKAGRETVENKESP
jgi:hypothetical protein